MNDRKTISLDDIYLRESHLQSGIIKRNRDCVYPLYQTYNEHYNYKNLRNALLEWYNFSTNMTANINKTVELLNIIGTNGTVSDLQEATDIVCRYIISYLPDPNAFRYNYNKLRESNNERLNECCDTIFDKIQEQVECDRAINNHALVSKRFNIDKLFRNILIEDTTVETVFNFCNLMDTYNLDLKTKYCIANECALQSASKHTQNVDYATISESIIDYYLLNYGYKDVPEFLSEMRDCISKDRFISNEASSYIDYLDTVYHIMNNDEEYKKEYFTKLSEDTNLSFVLEADEYNNLKNAMYNLHEMAYTDRAKLLFTKFKLSSVKSVGMVKSTISSLFSNVNEDDVKTVVKTALKIAFFTFIVLGAFAIAAMASIIGFICYQIYAHFFSNKAELKDAISELRDHRSEVNYKMKSEPDANRKDRMEAYVHELELQINKLQEKYDNMANPSNKVTDTSNTIADTATKIGNAAITGLGIYSAINNFSDMINSHLNLNKAEEGK